MSRYLASRTSGLEDTDDEYLQPPDRKHISLGKKFSSDDTTDQQKELEWPCPQCTLLNPYSITVCDACSYKRDFSGGKPKAKQISLKIAPPRFSGESEPSKPWPRHTPTQEELKQVYEGQKSPSDGAAAVTYEDSKPQPRKAQVKQVYDGKSSTKRNGNGMERVGLQNLEKNNQGHKTKKVWSSDDAENLQHQRSAPTASSPVAAVSPQARAVGVGPSPRAETERQMVTTTTTVRHIPPPGSRRDTAGGLAGLIPANLQQATNSAVAASSGSFSEDTSERQPPTVDAATTVEGTLSGLVFDFEKASAEMVPRTPLPWSVFHVESKKSWVATINTDQKALDSNNTGEASKALKAFQAPTEEQARALGKTYAPPRMYPYKEHPTCSICKVNFGVFRRPCHCRNCGVVICSACTVLWPWKMVPETFNIKREIRVKVCKTCDALSHAFRLALLEGNFEQAKKFHSTGNLNLVTPFATIKNEVMHPIHCAVIGGNLELLKWLVEEQYCPLTTASSQGRRAKFNRSAILTSKGKSMLYLAVMERHLHISRYLIAEKGMSLEEEKDIDPAVIIRTLSTVFCILPEESLREEVKVPVAEIQRPVIQEQGSVVSEVTGPSSESRPEDECIICFDNQIDCVATPCGHQTCCVSCAESFSTCPVCCQESEFIKVYKS